MKNIYMVWEVSLILYPQMRKIMRNLFHATPNTIDMKIIWKCPLNIGTVPNSNSTNMEMIERYGCNLKTETQLTRKWSIDIGMVSKLKFN